MSETKTKNYEKKILKYFFYFFLFLRQKEKDGREGNKSRKKASKKETMKERGEKKNVGLDKIMRERERN